jgi:hypothetical protein
VDGDVMAGELPGDAGDKLREIKEKYERMAEDARQRLKAIDAKLKAASSGEMDSVVEASEETPPAAGN